MKIKPRPYIGDMQEQYLNDNIRIYPCHGNRASECGHPCTRYLVYCRTNWSDRVPHGTTTQAIFELGKELEKVVVQGWLQDRLRLEVVSPKNADFSYPEVELTGHLDCYIEEEIDEGDIKGTIVASELDPHIRNTGKRIWVPVEIKGIAPNTWNTVNRFEDLLKSRYSWVRKWAGQLLVYMLMDGKPYGRFVFFNKTTGLIKDIPVVLEDHLDLAEEILSKLEEVNKHVKEGTLPDRIYGDGIPDKICEDCGFRMICLPGGSYEASLQLVDDPAIEETLDVYFDIDAEVEEAKAVIKSREDVGKDLRRMLKGKTNAIIGRYRVTGKQTKGKNSYWKWKAEVLGEEERTEE